MPFCTKKMRIGIHLQNLLLNIIVKYYILYIYDQLIEKIALQVESS